MSSNHNTIKNNNALLISDFAANGDNGVYSCKASNNAGHVMSKAIILNKNIGSFCFIQIHIKLFTINYNNLLK